MAVARTLPDKLRQGYPPPATQEAANGITTMEKRLPRLFQAIGSLKLLARHGRYLCGSSCGFAAIFCACRSRTGRPTQAVRPGRDTPRTVVDFTRRVSDGSAAFRSPLRSVSRGIGGSPVRLVSISDFKFASLRCPSAFPHFRDASWVSGWRLGIAVTGAPGTGLAMPESNGLKSSPDPRRSPIHPGENFARELLRTSSGFCAITNGKGCLTVEPFR